MTETVSPWPYAPTLARLALAIAIGLFVGIERERQHKEAGLRTFAFATLLGAVGGLLGDPFAIAALALVGLLVVFLNLEAMRTGAGAEVTTSAALIVMAYAGLLSGRGQTFTPMAIGVATAALLAWKGRMAGFSRALTEAEFSSAVLLAILAFIVYPALPEGSVDPWQLIDARAAWVTVILIAALGFGNYVLLKLYGTRGVEFTGFLGGVLNSTATVAELATRARKATPALTEAAYRGVLLATVAMVLRNGAILALLAPAALGYALLPLVLMLAVAATPVLTAWRRSHAAGDRPSIAVNALDDEHTVPGLDSPFSLTAAFKFGLVFLALQVAGSLAQRGLGAAGFYAISVLGGLVSSASAVASAASLVATGELTPQVAATGAIIASAMSALVNYPVFARVSQNRALSRRLAWMMLGLALLGVLGSLGAGRLVAPAAGALFGKARGILGR